MAPKQDIFWLKENSLYNKGRTLEKKLVFSQEKNWVGGGTPLSLISIKLNGTISKPLYRPFHIVNTDFRQKPDLRKQTKNYFQFFHFNIFTLRQNFFVLIKISYLQPFIEISKGPVLD